MNHTVHEQNISRKIDRQSLFFRCYSEAMISWNMLEINITNLILSISNASDGAALSAAINKVVAIQTRFEMLNTAFYHCNHKDKDIILKKWEAISGLFKSCSKIRNQLAHYCLLHRVNDEFKLEPMLIDNLLKFPRKKNEIDIIEIENIRCKFFALGIQLENLNHFIRGTLSPLPEDCEKIIEVHSVEEIFLRHGFEELHQ